MRKPVTKSSSQNNFVADAFKLEPNFCKRKTTPKFVIRSPNNTSEYKPLQAGSQEEYNYRRVDSMPVEKALMCRTSSQTETITTGHFIDQTSSNKFNFLSIPDGRKGGPQSLVSMKEIFPF